MILLDKQVLRVRRDADAFLNAYSTNLPEKPHNAFIDVKGRIVALFDTVREPDGSYLIVIGKAFTERLMKHLGKYLPLGETEITPETHSVYFDTESAVPPGPDDRVIPQKKGRLFLTRDPKSSTLSEDAFRQFRLENGIPVQGIDFDEELLLNVADEEFVSYTKGCYLGQEIIARVHHRSKPPKKLVVRRESECTSEENLRLTSRTHDPCTGQTMGFLFVENA